MRIVDTGTPGAGPIHADGIHVDGTVLRQSLRQVRPEADSVALENLPSQETPIVLCPGDILILTKILIQAASGSRHHGRLSSPKNFCIFPAILMTSGWRTNLAR
jgi:hypothetical protein